MSIASFYADREKSAHTEERLLPSIRFFPSVPTQLHEDISRVVYEVPGRERKEKKTLPPEVPSEGLDGLPVL